MTEASTTEPVQILCVCTGNVCRSPVAERLLGASLEPLGVRVISAGTQAPRDMEIAPQMLALLAGRGIDASDHTSRWLRAADVASSALVLGMERDHRGQAVALFPQALRRSFTLLGFAAIAQRLPPEELGRIANLGTAAERLGALVEIAPRYRQLAGAEDIDDPIGRDQATYDRVFGEIEDAVSAILGVLC